MEYQKMKVNNFKIEKAVAKNDVRDYLQHCYLDCEQKKLVATNGHIITALKVELDEDDTTGFIPVEAIIRERKIAKAAKREKLQIKANGTLILSNGDTMARPTGHKSFPNYQRVFNEKCYRNKQVVSVALNAKLLYELSQTIGSDNCVILEIEVNDPKSLTANSQEKNNSNFKAQFDKINESIKVSSFADNENDSLIMPLRT